VFVRPETTLKRLQKRSEERKRARA